MSSVAPSKPVPERVPLSVVTSRETVTDNPWINERWKVEGVICAPEQESGAVVRSILQSGPLGERYLWTGFELRLRRSEADAYYYNIIGQNPSLYIYCEPDDSGEPRPRFITAEYIEAMAHAEMGNTTFAVPMPPEVYRIVEQYVLENYEPEEPRSKRKHERGAGARADARDDDRTR